MRNTVINALLFGFCFIGGLSAAEPLPAISAAQGQPRTNLANSLTIPLDLSTNAASTNAGPYKVPENRIVEFLVPLSPAAKVSVESSKNAKVRFTRAAIAVPEGFEPDIPTPILLVNGTSDGNGSSIRPMHSFTNVALRLGWIVIAADGPFGKPAQDNPPWRWAMVSSLLDHIHKTWPNSKRWPIASAGISGGGKWAGVTGGILAAKGYNVIGVFMGAVNEDYASETARLYDPATAFKAVPIYLSSGTDDKVATVEHHEHVKENLLHNGFKTVRLEAFRGGHDLSQTGLQKALMWFIEEYGKESTETK